MAYAQSYGVPRSAFNEVAMPVILLIAGFSLALFLVGCHTGNPVPDRISRHITPAILVPHDVRRIAVLYPQTASAEWTQAYHRLEGAPFARKAHRPDLNIVDRLHLPVLLGEHRFQLAGAVADNSAVHIGHLLGPTQCSSIVSMVRPYAIECRLGSRAICAPLWSRVN